MTMEQQLAAELLPLAARVQGRKLGRIETCDIFAISRGWAAVTMQDEPGVATVRTPVELEEALCNPRAGAVFVPRYTFGWTMLERVLRRNAVVKTIFWEE
jgi:hypothetical protein